MTQLGRFKDSGDAWVTRPALSAWFMVGTGLNVRAGYAVGIRDDNGVPFIREAPGPDVSVIGVALTNAAESEAALVQYAGIVDNVPVLSGSRVEAGDAVRPSDDGISATTDVEQAFAVALSLGTGAGAAYYQFGFSNVIILVEANETGPAGNEITVQFTIPTGDNPDIVIGVINDDPDPGDHRIEVQVATVASNSISTGDEVTNAINADPEASALVTATCQNDCQAGLVDSDQTNTLANGYDRLDATILLGPLCRTID